MLAPPRSRPTAGGQIDVLAARPDLYKDRSGKSDKTLRLSSLSAWRRAEGPGQSADALTESTPYRSPPLAAWDAG